MRADVLERSPERGLLILAPDQGGRSQPKEPEPDADHLKSSLLVSGAQPLIGHLRYGALEVDETARR